MKTGTLKKQIKQNWWKYLVAAGILIIYLLPIYVVVVTSLKPMTDHTSRPVSYTHLSKTVLEGQGWITIDADTVDSFGF